MYVRIVNVNIYKLKFELSQHGVRSANKFFEFCWGGVCPTTKKAKFNLKSQFFLLFILEN